MRENVKWKYEESQDVSKTTGFLDDYGSEKMNPHGVWNEIPFPNHHFQAGATASWQPYNNCKLATVERARSVPPCFAEANRSWFRRKIAVGWVRVHIHKHLCTLWMHILIHLSRGFRHLYILSIYIDVSTRMNQRYISLVYMLIFWTCCGGDISTSTNQG